MKIFLHKKTNCSHDSIHHRRRSSQ